MPKVSEQYLETRQQQILDAAVVCFAEKGFYATTIEDICQKAGISHGAVYRYFEGKEDIIVATLRREQEDREARYYKIFHETDARRLLEGFISLYFYRRTEPEAEITMKFRMQLFGEMVRDPRIGEIQRESDDKMIQGTIEAFRKAQERGEINPHIDAAAVVRVVRALADGFYVQKSVNPDLDVAACMEATKAIFTTGDFWQKKR